MKIKEHLDKINSIIECGESLGEWEYRIPKIKKHLKQIKLLNNKRSGVCNCNRTNCEIC